MGRTIHGLILILLVLAAVSVAGCTDREEVIVDRTYIIPDNKEETIDLTSGTYRISIASDEELVISFNTMPELNQNRQKTFDRVVTFTEDTTITIKNWALLGLFGSDANVQVKIVKNPAN